jgi:hypothetical protein
MVVYLHFSSFQLLPDPVRRVKENALEEEHYRYPLIIGVVLLLILLSVRTLNKELIRHLCMRSMFYGIIPILYYVLE